MMLELTINAELVGELSGVDPAFGWLLQLHMARALDEAEVLIQHKFMALHRSEQQSCK